MTNRLMRTRNIKKISLFKSVFGTVYPSHPAEATAPKLDLFGKGL
jgi:hypothetical protein